MNVGMRPRETEAAHIRNRALRLIIQNLMTLLGKKNLRTHVREVLRPCRERLLPDTNELAMCLPKG